MYWGLARPMAKGKVQMDCVTGYAHWYKRVLLIHYTHTRRWRVGSAQHSWALERLGPPGSVGLVLAAGAGMRTRGPPCASFQREEVPKYSLYPGIGTSVPWDVALHPLFCPQWVSGPCAALDQICTGNALIFLSIMAAPTSKLFRRLLATCTNSIDNDNFYHHDFNCTTRLTPF